MCRRARASLCVFDSANPLSLSFYLFVSLSFSLSVSLSPSHSPFVDLSLRLSLSLPVKSFRCDFTMLQNEFSLLTQHFSITTLLNLYCFPTNYLFPYRLSPPNASFPYPVILPSRIEKLMQSLLESFFMLLLDSNSDTAKIKRNDNWAM